MLPLPFRFARPETKKGRPKTEFLEASDESPETGNQILGLPILVIGLPFLVSALRFPTCGA